jgi:hypothetical protein
MNETKKIGIGYTIFEFEGEKKRPLTMVKVKSGNFMKELRHLEERMKNGKINLVWLCMGAFAYGYMIRTVLEIM